MYFWEADEAEIVFRRQQWVHLHQRGRNVSLRAVDHSGRLITELHRCRLRNYVNYVTTSVNPWLRVGAALPRVVHTLLRQSVSQCVSQPVSQCIS